VEGLTNNPVLVLNSHTHPDHIGGNHEFKTILGVDTAFTKTNSKGYSDPEMKDWVGRDNVCGELPKGFAPSAYAIRPFSISRHIQDGEILDLGDRKIEILQTPGHTPDALCILDRQNRILFTGDTFYAGPIYLYSPETDFDAYARSVNRLATLEKDVDALLTAHNSPEAPSSALGRLKEAVEKIRSGEMKPMEKDGLREYFFQSFSILMK
jgi:glyoxylase-like metal-dependent hydrolase (beta-lactamase superfamily II)